MEPGPILRPPRPDDVRAVPDLRGLGRPASHIPAGVAPDGAAGSASTPSQTSWIYSSTAIAGLVAPLILGLLADRLFATQRLLGCLHFVGAAVLFAAARFCSHQQVVLQTSDDAAGDNAWTFAGLMALMLANAFVLILTLALCNVTGLRNLREPKRSYGRIRVFGTVGWIMVSVAMDFLGDPVSAQPLYVAAAGSVFMGFYSFTLPHTPPARMGKGIADALGVPALGMFRKPEFRVLIASAMSMAAVQQFYALYAQSVPGRSGHVETDGAADARPGVRGRVPARVPTGPGPVRVQGDAGGRHLRLDCSERAVRDRLAAGHRRRRAAAPRHVLLVFLPGVQRLRGPARPAAPAGQHQGILTFTVAGLGTLLRQLAEPR